MKIFTGFSSSSEESHNEGGRRRFTSESSPQAKKPRFFLEKKDIKATCPLSSEEINPAPLVPFPQRLLQKIKDEEMIQSRPCLSSSCNCPSTKGNYCQSIARSLPVKYIPKLRESMIIQPKDREDDVKTLSESMKTFSLGNKYQIS